MGNMTYVQFENTYRDLRQCCDAMYDELSPEEEKFRKRLIELCKEIAEEFGDEDSGNCENNIFCVHVYTV